MVKIGLIVLVLGLVGCATPKAEPFSGLCAIQPMAQQEGIILAAVQCQ